MFLFFLLFSFSRPNQGFRKYPNPKAWPWNIIFATVAYNLCCPEPLPQSQPRVWVREIWVCGGCRSGFVVALLFLGWLLLAYQVSLVITTNNPNSCLATQSLSAYPTLPKHLFFLSFFFFFFKFHFPFLLSTHASFKQQKIFQWIIL